MTTRLKTLTRDQRQQPLRATIATPFGRVRIVWQSLHGQRCWFNLGPLEGKCLALPLIQHLERLIEQLRAKNKIRKTQNPQP